jgi:putative tricarboxylic transport membrane protein
VADRRRHIDLVTRMHDSPSWREAATANGWTDDFVTGAAFARFLAAESARVRDVLDRLGV